MGTPPPPHPRPKKKGAPPSPLLRLDLLSLLRLELAGKITELQEGSPLLVSCSSCLQSNNEFDQSMACIMPTHSLIHPFGDLYDLSLAQIRPADLSVFQDLLILG